MRRERDASYMKEARTHEDEERDAADVEGGGYEGVALAIMAAIARNERAAMILNVRNGTTLPGLPPEAVVEVPCTVDADGPHPLTARPLAGAMLGLVQQVKAVEQLTIEASLTRLGAAGRAGPGAAPAGRLGDDGTGPARGLPGADPGDRRAAALTRPGAARCRSGRGPGPGGPAGRCDRLGWAPWPDPMPPPSSRTPSTGAPGAVLRARGWRPRMISYTGYGSPDFVRVLGRVVLSRNHDEPIAADARASLRELYGRRGGAAGAGAPSSPRRRWVCRWTVSVG